MRCTACESVDTTKSCFCESCGRALPAVSSAAPVAVDTEADGWAADTPVSGGGAREPALEPACPGPGIGHPGQQATAPAVDVPPAPAPGSIDYLRSCQGGTTLDSGHPQDATSLDAAMRGEQATAPVSLPEPSAEPASGVFGHAVIDDLRADEEYPAVAPWWAARLPPPASSVAATNTPSADTTSVASPTKSTACQPAAAGPAQAPAPARETRPRHPRGGSPQRPVVRTAAVPAERLSAPRQVGRAMRLLAHAAVALVAVGAVSLLGAPVVGQWSQVLKGSVGSYLDIAAPKIPATGDEGADSRARLDADALVPEPVRRATVPGPSPARPGGTTAAARPVQATSTAAPPSTRPSRNSRGSQAALPTREADLAARRDTVEPLIVTPLANPDAAATVAPMATVAPSDVESVAPATALEVTKVDVRPGIVKRVDARASGAPGGTPEMVVLRVLVSATGSPATVKVLRGSKSDPASDGVAVAAVKQWAFSPAIKRGRPVDCWFNVAVPVEGTAQ